MISMLKLESVLDKYHWPLNVLAF